MNGIKKTFMAGVLACATFNIHAERSPFDYGIKLGVGTSSAAELGKDVKVLGKKVKSSFFDTLALCGSLYGAYAFTENFGVELEAGYMTQGTSLTGEEEHEAGDHNASTSPQKSIGIASGGIFIPLYLCWYPCGREAEEGILKVFAGPSAYFPLNREYTSKQGNEEHKPISLNDDQKKQAQLYDIGATGGIGYEFPFGLSIEAKYSRGFVNRFKTEGDTSQTMLTEANADVMDLKKLCMHNATINIGYNFASLLSE